MFNIDRHLVQIWEKNKFIGNGAIVVTEEGKRKLVTAGHVALHEGKWTEYEVRQGEKRIDLPKSLGFSVYNEIDDYAEMPLDGNGGLPLAKNVSSREILRMVGSTQDKGKYEIEVRVREGKDINLQNTSLTYLAYEAVNPNNSFAPGTSGSVLLNESGEMVCLHVGTFKWGSGIGNLIKK